MILFLIKFCQIDEPSMKFWRGLTRQSGSNGNPFAEPLNLPSNINGGLEYGLDMVLLIIKFQLLKKLLSLRNIFQKIFLIFYKKTYYE